MYRHLAIAVVIAFGALGWAVPAGAGVIFDNGAPLVDPTSRANALFSDFDFPNQIADDFTLAPDANTITDVHWWGVYGFSNTPPVADDFTIRIFADASGAPAVNPAHEFAVGAVGRTATIPATTIAGLDVFEFWTAIPATTLAAGTPFWLSIVNDTPALPGTTNDDWAWAISAAPGGNDFFRSTDSDTWSPDNLGLRELAFRLTNDAVPEPATLALFAAGLLALGFLRRRRRPVRVA